MVALLNFACSQVCNSIQEHRREADYAILYGS